MAGGGIKPGQTIGETDDSASHPRATKWISTICMPPCSSCLGLDHTKLTFKFQGRNFRLTDVSGNLIQKLLA